MIGCASIVWWPNGPSGNANHDYFTRHLLVTKNGYQKDVYQQEEIQRTLTLSFALPNAFSRRLL